ncbi:MAG: T9SS type A sorting domain-containing protein [Bacteroidota bacterium]
MKSSILSFFLLFSLFYSNLHCQNETKRWHFGAYAALDFMNTPPTILASSNMSVVEGCASIANAAGNLLFYTNGVSVWNQANAVMANGTNLSGSLTPTQSSIIIKQPGSSNIYYIFTVGGTTVTPGLCYSIVNMTLAAGMGSVTTKNAVLYAPACKEKLTATLHCNRNDVWIVAVEAGTNNFRSYLLTATGIAANPPVSVAGPNSTYFTGCMKISPNGRKLGNVTPTGNVELYDFDNATGFLTNQLILENNSGAYGCEFSPDGTKFYSNHTGPNRLKQWNICAGATAAIISTAVTFTSSLQLYSMQLAPDNKIYIGRPNQQNLGVINNPNVTGTGCNFVEVGQSVSPRLTAAGLPNFMGSFFKAPTPAFTFTMTPAASCQTVSFSSPYSSGLNCAVSGNSIISLHWDFGDTFAGSTNTSTIFNPVHVYSGAGTFLPKLVVNYNCYSDTIQIPITIAGPLPAVNISGNLLLCKGQTATLTASGGSSYVWNNGFTSSSIIVSPINTNTYSVQGYHTVNSCSNKKIATVYVYPCTALEAQAQDDLPLLVYPNPTSDELFIEVQKDLRFTIYSVLGTKVLEGVFQKGNHQLQLREYDNGIYFLKFNDGKSAGTLRIVKTD